MATLKITTGPAQGQSIECDREVTVGRENADLVIDDSEMSRRHAAIRPGADGVEVEDFDSLNGTFVDGERITAVTTLTKTAKLSMGVTEFILEMSARDLPVADPQRTVVRGQPIIDVPDKTVVRDQPIIDVPDKTVVRDQPIVDVPDKTVVRATQPPPPSTGVPAGAPPGGPPAGAPAGGPPGGFPPGGFPAGGPPGGFPAGGPPKLPPPVRMLMRSPVGKLLLPLMLRLPPKVRPLVPVLFIVLVVAVVVVVVIVLV